MHKQSRGTALAVLLCCFCFPVFAQEIPATQPIISPVEVLRGENGELQTMEKVYVLSKDADPGMIPTENFTGNGVEYVFAELRQQDNSVEESKPHTETVSIHTSSNDTETVVSQFKPELEAETEDGYTGKLSFDSTSLDVVAAGYGTESYAVSEERTYPNLTDADTSLVPKTVTKDGAVLKLTNIEWNSAASEDIDGQELAVRYTAIATYSGTATRTYTKGYTATATYRGELKRTVTDTVTYTAVFQELPKPEPTPEPTPAPAPIPEPEKKSLLSYWWAYLIGAAGLGGCGYGIYRIIRKRKKGY